MSRHHQLYNGTTSTVGVGPTNIRLSASKAIGKVLWGYNRVQPTHSSMALTCATCALLQSVNGNGMENLMVIRWPTGRNVCSELLWIVVNAGQVYFDK